MNKEKFVFLVYQKDFSEHGKDRYFIYEDCMFSEVNSTYVASIDCFLVVHDFWLIANSLYKEYKSLPSKVIDVVVLAKIIAGTKSVDGDVQPWDISKTIKPLFINAEEFNSYEDIYYRRKELTFDSYKLFSHKLADYFDQISKRASDIGEINRFIN